MDGGRVQSAEQAEDGSHNWKTFINTPLGREVIPERVGRGGDCYRKTVMFIGKSVAQ